MQERRKHPRKQTRKRLEVFDVNTDQRIGNLVDISMGGIMLISNRLVEVNSVYQLSLRIPEDYDGEKDINFGGEVLWTETTHDIQQHWVGFEIIDISPEAGKRIDQLIKSEYL